MGTLSGKVALITGAGRGFGRAIAEVFIEAGADVALNYRESQAACRGNRGSRVRRLANERCS